MAALLAAAGACGSDPPNTVPTPQGGSSGRGGSGGRGGTTGGSAGGTTGGSAGGTTGGSAGGTTGGSAGGTTGGSAGGTGGSTGGTGGATGGTGGSTGGTGGSTGGTGGSATDGPPAEMPPSSTTDWMGYPGVRDLSQQDPTSGCGKAPMGLTPGSWQSFDITNIPVPAGQSGNAGDGTRRYFVRLPPNYNNMTKYKLLIAASSCTGGSQALRAMPDVANVTDGAGGAILISPVVEPGVWDPDECYDDKDPNSIEHPFLERFLAQVGEKACYDKNKVFVQGHSSGGWYSNMIGFTHTTGLIRAMSSNGGGLPDNSAERPKLTDKPMAGLWIHPTQDTEQPMAARRSVSRALVMNKCMGAGTNPADETVHMRAPSEPWAMGGAQGCKKYMCPAAFPVIFCTPAAAHQDLSWHSDAAWAFFNSLP
jgi:hypothetical protein